MTCSAYEFHAITPFSGAAKRLPEGCCMRRGLMALVSCLMVFVCLALAVCDAAAAPAKARSAKRTPLVATDTPKPKKVDSHTLSRRGVHYRVNISYPQLGVPTADAELTIWARDQASTFIESVQQIPTPMPMPYELSIVYETITASTRSTSVVFTISTFMGGVHAEPGLATFAYNKRDGRRLTYGDLFLKTEGLMNALSELCRESLAQQLGSRADSRMLAEGTAPNMVNFDLFALTDMGLRIYFPPYQAAPLKEGYLYVDIPLKKVAGFKPQLSFWNKRKL